LQPGDEGPTESREASTAAVAGVVMDADKRPMVDHCAEHGWLRTHDGWGERGYCPYGDHYCGVFRATLEPVEGVERARRWGDAAQK